ncbi:hypothetical protein C943_00115 [Mariniradius saccharolyticus AK6]|uniref:Uncharacterized protein n=1 Tax=Mariniradius saccharolyticus AK6 TaxID=1239962 RepID=M7Y3N7_9BACT|nr:hypothetical protein C943_00115 [Mariniradius saccharolyticus AK6]
MVLSKKHKSQKLSSLAQNNQFLPFSFLQIPAIHLHLQSVKERIT